MPAAVMAASKLVERHEMVGDEDDVKEKADNMLTLWFENRLEGFNGPTLPRPLYRTGAIRGLPSRPYVEVIRPTRISILHIPRDLCQREVVLVAVCNFAREVGAVRFYVLLEDEIMSGLRQDLRHDMQSHQLKFFQISSGGNDEQSGDTTHYFVIECEPRN
jgi:hypothetical protein